MVVKNQKQSFFDFINEFKDKLGEKWSSIELIISDIAKAIAYVKKHLEENSQIIEWRSTDDLTKLKKKFITKSNYIAFKVVIARLSGYRFIYIRIVVGNKSLMCAMKNVFKHLKS
ncbi:hypothetical protein [Streptococcus infantarius]|uniref:hypothetical protein n=1 Tax=Streptococcus infantarius TaxID=102684 RepID=UPI0022E55FE9|nr:hypothetical protein [Streptococcus infantarius]